MQGPSCGSLPKHHSAYRGANSTSSLETRRVGNCRHTTDASQSRRANDASCSALRQEQRYNARELQELRLLQERRVQDQMLKHLKRLRFRRQQQQEQRTDLPPPAPSPVGVRQLENATASYSSSPNSSVYFSAESLLEGEEGLEQGKVVEEAVEEPVVARKLSWQGEGPEDARARQELEHRLQELVFSDPSIVREVHQGKEGSLVNVAKETNHVDVNCDVTGAACINQYVVVKSLGQGSHGRVRMCLNVVDGQLYAIKTIKRAFIPSKLMRNPKARGPGRPNSLPAGRKQTKSETDATSQVLREIAIMKKLDHHNVVKLHEVIDPPGKDNVILVTEYLEKGNLLQRRDIGKGKILFEQIPETNTKEKFRMVCRGLDYLHYNGIVHGDLKPDNILVSGNGDVKIADFTCSRMVTPEHFTSGVYGTPAFHAPEVISGEKYNPYAADIWALGVCMYCAVVGELPFSGSRMLEMYRNIDEARLEYPADCKVSDDFKDLLSRIFVKDVSSRIDLEGIMQHRWITENGKVRIAGLGSLEHPPSVIKVTTTDEDSAIDRSSVVSFIRAKFKERVYREGEILYSEGAECTCLFFILKGYVLLTGDISISQGDEADIDQVSLELDVDEELFLSQKVQLPEDGVLKLSKTEARALQKRRRDLFLKDPGNAGSIAKGPGQMLGELSGKHLQSARAKTDATVLKLNLTDLDEAFHRDQERIQRQQVTRETNTCISRTVSLDFGQSLSSEYTNHASADSS